MKNKNTGPVAQLEEQRAELAAAETALADAERQRDADAASACEARVKWLRRFVAEREVEAAAELEQQAERRAKKWLRDHAAELRTIPDRVAAAQDKVRASLSALLADVEAEMALRAMVGEGVLGAELLCARFPNVAANGDRMPPLPPFEDYAVPVVRATDVMFRRAGSRNLVVGTVASDTQEMLQRKRLAALKKFVEQDSNMVRKGKRKSEIPDDVRDLLLAAPFPEVELTPKPPQKSQAERMADDVAMTQRALSAFPGATVNSL